ncbi:MAG TPA: peptidoglycan-binding protein, partial [Rhizomicrobium sp.]|nr:peptidoglycan-binding protein [Rhizomicrobium sp.]
MIGSQTRSWSGLFQGTLILSLLLLLTGIAQAQTTRQALESTLAMRRMTQPADAAPDPLYDFYARRNFQPAWTGSARAENAAALVIGTLAESDAQGLRPADYAATATRWNTPPETGAAAAAYDLSLTEDLLRYARDVRLGRVTPSRVYTDVALPSRLFDAGPALNKALADNRLDAFLKDLPPPHAEYRALVAALARYREREANGGWLPLSRGTDTLSLTIRLAAEDSVLATNPFPSDDELRQAVMRFQIRNGLAADGRVGAETLAALNVPIKARIDQIVANLERWRWLPRQFEDRTIRVNVPDQLVGYYRGD